MLSCFANPARFLRLSAWGLPVLTGLASLLLAIGLPWALLFAPADYLQGESVRMMFVHVPAAWWALGGFMALAGASFVHLVWCHALADVAARAIAPIGAVYAGLCLVTGSLWGRPTWGTYWVWDGRLTSMLILFLSYLGYLALRAAMENAQRGARLGAVLALASAVNVPIVHFSVDWWNTLHQPSSLLRAGGSAIDPALLWPLLIMGLAYGAAFAALCVAGMRAQVLEQALLRLQPARGGA